ncbi:hypothetical protein [Tetragenococcus halophilus]|uniref:hypothetical protein n=1 Tax=Tetragenococcus halophilus TaxID=51669 RepID=UPI002A98ABB0|nr:hypothetical protein TEHSL10_11370 [Tetragenococcus halophilus]
MPNTPYAPQLLTVIKIAIPDGFMSDLIITIVGSLISGGIAFGIAYFTSKHESDKLKKQVSEEKEATLSLERTLYLEKMELDDLLKLENELDYSAEIFVAMHREINKKLSGMPTNKNMVDIIGDLSSNLTRIGELMKQYFSNELEQEIFNEYLSKAKEFEKYLLKDEENISKKNIEEVHRSLVDRNDKLLGIVSSERYRKFNEMRDKTIESN